MSPAAPRPLAVVCCVLAAVTLLSLHTATAKSVPGKMISNCKACNYISSPKTMKFAAVCSACGEMYGWELEHCCLCHTFYYNKCKGAVTSIYGSFGRRK